MKSLTSGDERYERLRTLLAEARKRQRITQIELARRLDRLQSFVSNYERGSRQLDVIEFIDVAKALELDPVKLLRQLAS